MTRSKPPTPDAAWPPPASAQLTASALLTAGTAAGQTRRRAVAASGQAFKPDPKPSGRAVPASTSGSAPEAGTACLYPGMHKPPGVRHATRSGARLGDPADRARQICSGLEACR